MCVLNGAGVYWWSSILSDLVHTDACHHVAHVPVCSVMKESELIKETVSRQRKCTRADQSLFRLVSCSNKSQVEMKERNRVHEVMVDFEPSS